MTPVEIAALLVAMRLLSGKKTPARAPAPSTPMRPPPMATPPPPAPGLPAKPTEIQWPQAGVPGATATVAPGRPGQPGGPAYGQPGAPPAGIPHATATITHEPAPPPPRPPPPPPVVDEKMPTMQKGAPAVSTAAQKGIDAMKQDHSGTGKRQFKPKRKHLTQSDIKRAKELLGGWEKGKRWFANDDPSTMFVAALHGTKRAIEVWTSNPDNW